MQKSQEGVRKLKAWSVTDKDDPMYTAIVFAETRGKARKLAQSTDACEDLDFTQIRVLREPKLDEFYRGEWQMDWCNPADRVAMVRYGNMMCSYEVDISEEKCSACSAHEWCSRYEDMHEEN